MKLSELEKAIFIINLTIVQQNVRWMKQKAGEHNLRFRPHFKTHQSKEVASLLKNEGVNEITVSSMDMCLKAIEMGFYDICIGIPFNLNEINRLNAISEQVKIQICLDSMAVFIGLEKALTRKVDFYIKTDAGYGRSGLTIDKIDEFKALIDAGKLSKHLHFHGLLVHNGQMYGAKTTSNILQLHNNSLCALHELIAKLPEDVMLSIGDTPAISITDNFNGVDEIRPGNFVYYDLMQEQLGVCKENKIAVRLLAPVIGKYPERNELVIHAGAIHLSKETIQIKEEICYGQVVAVHTKQARIPLNKRLNVIRLSQEHGIIYAESEIQANIKHGDFLEIIPVHACLTANLMLNNALYVD